MLRHGVWVVKGDETIATRRLRPMEPGVEGGESVD